HVALRREQMTAEEGKLPAPDVQDARGVPADGALDVAHRSPVPFPEVTVVGGILEEIAAEDDALVDPIELRPRDAARRSGAKRRETRVPCGLRHRPSALPIR